MEAGALLLRLLALLVAARLAAELAERLKLPAVLVEITAGILLGPSLLGFVGHEESLHFLGELGAIFLLLEVGLHMDLADLRRVGRGAMLVAIVGVALPLVGGIVGMRVIGIDGRVALFLGAGITATSVGITARVFADMRTLASTEAQTVLGAAVADDVIGLLILTVVARLSESGSVEAGTIALIAVTGIGFVIVATGLGTWLAPLLFNRVVSRARTDGALIGTAIAFTMAFAGLAAAARLAPIVGAFVAGLALGRIEERDDLQRRIAPLAHLFVPVFFLLIGAEARVGALGEDGALVIVGVLGVIGLAGKLAAGYVMRRGTVDRLIVGIGMVPRGEVGVVFATLGLASGVLGAREHAALLTVVLATTLIAPPWLRKRIERGRRVALERAAEDAPDGGWLDVGADEVELRAEPPFGLAGRIGIEAALACAHRRPGGRLLDWLSRASAEPSAWDGELRALFLRLLREGNARSWRLLEVTGVLSILVPEIDAELRRRKQDVFELDPAGALRWEEVEALDDLVRSDDPAARLWPDIDRDAVLVAALARSAFRGAGSTTAAERLAQTLGLDEDSVGFVSFLVKERGLLPAAAARLAIGSEEAVLVLAAHIASRPRADALYMLAAATAEDVLQRAAVDELYSLIVSALAQPDVYGAASVSVVDTTKARVIDALPRMADVAQRFLGAAPRRYLLTHRPEVIARHIRMLDPLPSRGEVRIHGEPDLAKGEWMIDVVTLDRPGVLSAITSAFARYGVPILEAWISTWSNSAAVDVFRVTATRDLDLEGLRTAMVAELAHSSKNGGPSPVDGDIRIDNLASPWHTIVELRTADRAGLLHRVAQLFTRTGMQIVHATARTEDGVAVDSFFVSDRYGHKLDARGERDLRLAFSGKPSGRSRVQRLTRRTPV